MRYRPSRTVLFAASLAIASFSSNYVRAQDEQRFSSVASMTQISCGAFFRDDFHDNKLDKTWHIWPVPKGSGAFVREEEGEVRASRGGVVWRRTSDGDCVLETDTGVLKGTAPHHWQVHLCAGSGGGPDYSMASYAILTKDRIYWNSQYHVEVGTEGVTRGYVNDPSDVNKKPS